MPHHIEANGIRVQDLYLIMPDVVAKMCQFGLETRAIFDVHGWNRNDFESGRRQLIDLDSKGALPVSVTYDDASGRYGLYRGTDAKNPATLRRRAEIEVGEGLADEMSSMHADAFTHHPKKWFEDAMVNGLQARSAKVSKKAMSSHCTTGRAQVHGRVTARCLLDRLVVDLQLRVKGHPTICWATEPTRCPLAQ